jgi:regulator of CtrA degradation
MTGLKGKKVMQVATAEGRMTPRLVDSFYVEAMVLADEVRAYFDEHGRSEREALPPMQRVSFSCESLKVTTRLMHVIAWLLTRRAVEAGEITNDQARQPARRLGVAADSDPAVLAPLPETARSLIEASRDLYARVRRLDEGIDRPELRPSPARGLFSLLERAF